tara:strand:+ start:1706 stop:3427 length:1722 start_codon:yes stop_codon:yes gene_type:complete
MATYKVYGFDSSNIVPVIPSSTDDLQVPGNIVVDGNMTVSGTTSTVDSEVILSDAFVHVNGKYMTDTAKDAGFVITVDPEANELNGDLNISATTIVKSGSHASNFPANKIIQITNAEDSANNGLYQIHSSAESGGNTTITIKDASTNVPNADVTGIVNTSLTTNSDDDTAKIRVVKVAIFKTDQANDAFKFGFGSDASSLSFETILTDATSVTASSVAADDISAGDAAVNLTTTSGNITINAQASDSDIILKGSDGGVETTFLTLDGSAAGEAIFNAGIVIADGGNIGSASDKDAIAIASGGDVTLTQDLIFADGKTIHSGTTADLVTVNANDLQVKTGKSILVDTINESGSAQGVTVEGVLLKDNSIVIPNDANIGSVGTAAAIGIDSNGKVTLANNLQLPNDGTIGVSGDTDAISIASSGKVTITSDLACSSDVELTVGKGIGYEFTANEAVLAGEVLYFGSNGKVAKADADNLSTSAVIAIALEGGAADDTILCNTMYGAIIDIELASTETFNRGVAIYLDENVSGRGTATAPSATGDVVLRLGYAYEAGNGSLNEVKVIYAPEFITQRG